MTNQWHALERTQQTRPVSAHLRMGRGGKNVHRLGLDADFEPSSEIDSLPLVAIVERDPLRVVAV